MVTRKKKAYVFTFSRFDDWACLFGSPVIPHDKS